MDEDDKQPEDSEMKESEEIKKEDENTENKVAQTQFTGIFIRRRFPIGAFDDDEPSTSTGRTREKSVQNVAGSSSSEPQPSTSSGNPARYARDMGGRMACEPQPSTSSVFISARNIEKMSIGSACDSQPSTSSGHSAARDARGIGARMAREPPPIISGRYVPDPDAQYRVIRNQQPPTFWTHSLRENRSGAAAGGEFRRPYPVDRQPDHQRPSTSQGIGHKRNAQGSVLRNFRVSPVIDNQQPSTSRGSASQMGVAKKVAKLSDGGKVNDPQPSTSQAISPERNVQSKINKREGYRCRQCSGKRAESKKDGSDKESPDKNDPKKKSSQKNDEKKPEPRTYWDSVFPAERCVKCGKKASMPQIMEDFETVRIDPTPRTAGPPELLPSEEITLRGLHMLVVGDQRREETGREEDKENAGRPPKRFRGIAIYVENPRQEEEDERLKRRLGRRYASTADHYRPEDDLVQPTPIYPKLESEYESDEPETEKPPEKENS